MNFFKSFLASCLGALVAMGVLVFLGISLLIGLASSVSTEEVTTVSSKSVLSLKLNAPISEMEVEDPVAELFPGAANQSAGLLQLRTTILQAKEDTNIEGIYLQTSMTQAGITTLSEIRDALNAFKSSGKWVVAYSTDYSEGAYYLSSVADRIYMHPEGMVEFNGLAAEVTFFKKLFDNLEIRPEVFRVGEFKSAVEPFLRSDLSEENKLQMNTMLHAIHSQMLADVSASRQIPVERLKAIADDMLVRTADQAVSEKLIDSLAYEDGALADMRERLGLSKDGDISFVKYGRYKKAQTGTTSSTSSNEIAVIVADGAIIPGKSDDGYVGDVTMVEALKRARESSRVKAVVLRVNSPGGSFMASDVMWNAIRETSAEKPVIASMGDYAASGGYYLSMACDSIVAKPTTITGSIGIFSVMFDLSQFLDHKLGITSAEVKTGNIGDLVTVTRPLSDVEKGIWQKQTDRIYEVFTRKAAEGRRMSQDELKKIASGRVWTGSEAIENGLVDKLGGFEDAVAMAAGAAGVDDYKLRYYPHQKTFVEKIMGNKDDDGVARAIAQVLGDESILYRQWLRIRQYQGVQARMPYQFEIH